MEWCIYGSCVYIEVVYIRSCVYMKLCILRVVLGVVREPFCARKNVSKILV